MSDRMHTCQPSAEPTDVAQHMGAWLGIALSLSGACLFATAALVLMPLALAQPQRDRPGSLRPRKALDNDHASTAKVYFGVDFQHKR